MKYVSFLDILGFKDLIEKNSTSSLLKVYKESLEKSYKLVIEEYSNYEELKDDNAIIKIKIISDSLILWTENTGHNSFIKLCTLTSAMTYTLFRFGIPLRGGLDIGDLEEITINENTIDRSSVLLGQGLTGAYNIESTQQWSGCTISDKAIAHFKSLNIPESDRMTVDDLLSCKTLMKYNTPIKTGLIKEYYVLNWPSFYDHKPSPQEVRSQFSMHNKLINNWDVEYKIRNTIDFINYSFSS